MRVKFIIGILAVIAALYYLIYTVSDVQRIDRERQQQTREQEVILTPTAGVTLYVGGIIQETQTEIKYESSKPEEVEEVRTLEYHISDSDAMILENLAMAEAEGEGIEGKALVMRVVINRVQDPRFPDSIEDVVFQAGQFSTVNKGGRFWNMTADRECEDALKLVSDGWDESDGALYFESCVKDSWQSRNCTFLFEYGGHRFYE